MEELIKEIRNMIKEYDEKFKNTDSKQLKFVYWKMVEDLKHIADKADDAQYE